MASSWIATSNPEHLFEQAERLIPPPAAGPLRQVDVRRAISSAYYAVFPALLTAAADEFVGKIKRATPEYSLLYRSINHGSLRQLCEGLKGAQSPKRVLSHSPAGEFGPNIQALSLAFLDLYERRISADYDPSIRVKTADALLTKRTGRSALARFSRATSAFAA